jgi:hypothetical protein
MNGPVATDQPKPTPRFSATGLLLALLLLFLATPFVEDMRFGDLIEAVLVTLVMVAALFAVGRGRAALWVGLALVIPALAGKWLNHFRPDLVPAAVFLLLGLVFMGFVVGCLLRSIVRASRVTFEVLCAGISAYLLLGLLWVFAYGLVGGLDHSAFVFSVGPAGTQTMSGFNAFYFSFTTLTTAGYGDITPVSKPARMLAALEMIVGVLYVAVLISRLVALHAMPLPSPSSGAEGK